MGFYDPGVPKLPCNSACFDLKSIFLGLWETCDTNSPFHVRLKLGSRSKDSFSKIPCTNQIISKSKLITEFHQILINIYPQLGATVNFFPVFPDSSSTLGNPLYAKVTNNSTEMVLSSLVHKPRSPGYDIWANTGLFYKIFQGTSIKTDVSFLTSEHLHSHIVYYCMSSKSQATLAKELCQPTHISVYQLTSQAPHLMWRVWRPSGEWKVCQIIFRLGSSV